MKRFVLLAGTLLAGAVLTWRVVAVAGEIRRQSTIDEARPADVIVILGAAEYRGKPSPVLKARLDHGLELYRRGLAPRILTTGGSGGDPVFTEGEVGRAYLVRQNVPSEAILVEPEGASTAESTTAVAEMMRRMGMRTCLVVSDGYHIYRAKRMLERRGLRAYGSPRPSPAGGSAGQWWLYLRQAVGYILWSVGIRV
jgi:uncharacterized SAM-binding protein YcdF (DUF218 family)